MIYFKKTDGTRLQLLLDKAKVRDTENTYRSGVIYEQIRDDFHGKCYICESDEVMSIQIEHFEPHRGNKDRKFDWKNLFYSCAHCNSIKGHQFWPLLNCTDIDDQIWESIEIELTLFPKTAVTVKLSANCPRPAAGEKTRQLVEKVLTGKGTTAMKTDQAATLRRKMVTAHSAVSAAIERRDMAAIKTALSDSAPYAGMLRWYVKNNFPVLFDEWVTGLCIIGE